MKYLFIGVFALALTSCSTINNTITGCNNNVFIEQPKTVNTVPSLTASGNEVPISAIP